MAKKKQKKVNPQAELSPEKYIKQKARNLPVVECWISEGWQEMKFGQSIVVRQHKSGNYTLGFYLIDMGCLGVKDTFYKFNMPSDEFDAFKERCENNYPMEPITYNELHNLIYGSIAYAEEAGIKPHKDFALTQYILEEDTDDIPLIEYDFGGENGQPLLAVHSEFEASKYLPILRKTLGEGNFTYLIEESAEDYDDDDDDYYDDYEEGDDGEEEDDNNFDPDSWLANYLSMPHTVYTYTPPEYPQELTYKHKILDELFKPENDTELPKDIIDEILALPHDELVDELKEIVLYTIGQTPKYVADMEQDDNLVPVMMHAILLLGELRDESSLEVVLEVMRQGDDFYEYHFGDFAYDFMGLTLYYVGHNHLDRLYRFLQEPGLFIYLRSIIFDSISFITPNEPERRDEVIKWYSTVIQFYIDNRDHTEVYDATLIGFMINNIMLLSAKELIPLVTKLFETCIIDTSVCGDYDEIMAEMEECIGVDEAIHSAKLLDIHERYAQYNQ